MTDTLSLLANPYVLLAMDPNAVSPTDPTAFVPLSAMAASGLLAGYKLLTFSASAAPGALSLTGRQDITVTVTGVLSTDIVIQVSPTAAMPANLTIGYFYVSAANTMKVAITTPILYIGTPTIPLFISVLRPVS